MLGQRNKLTVRGGRDERVAAIAAQQRGRVARRQLLAAGLRPGQITRLQASDRLFGLHAGVYAAGHPGPVPLGDETAALLAMRDGARLTHLTAARIWGLAELPDDGLVHVLLDPRWARPPARVRVHRSRLLVAADCRIRSQLPVVSPARVLLDLAGDLDRRTLDRAYDQAQILGIVRPRELTALLGRTRGHPGHAALGTLAAEHAGRAPTRSVAEQRLLELLHAADLPRPLVNRHLHGYEVDFHWPRAGLIVEVDGYRYHSTGAAVERDHVRDQRLRDAGFEVLRVTWRQLEREPFAVVARIAAALTRLTRQPR